MVQELTQVLYDKHTMKLSLIFDLRNFTHQEEKHKPPALFANSLEGNPALIWLLKAFLSTLKSGSCTCAHFPL